MASPLHVCPVGCGRYQRHEQAGRVSSAPDKGGTMTAKVSPAADDELDPFAAKDRIFGVGQMRDPHPRLHELLAQCPVHHNSMSGLFGMVGPDNFLYSNDESI